MKLAGLYDYFNRITDPRSKLGKTVCTQHNIGLDGAGKIRWAG